MERLQLQISSSGTFEDLFKLAASYLRARKADAMKFSHSRPCDYPLESI